MNNGTTVVVGRILSVMLGFINAPIIAYSLGPEGRGASSAAIAILGLLPIISGLGIPLVVRRAAVDQHELGRFIRSARILSGLLSVPTVLVSIVIGHLFLNALEPVDLAAYLVGAMLCPLAVLWICNVNALVSQGRLFLFAVANLVPAIVNTAVLVAGAFTSTLTVELVIWANVLSNVVTFIVTSFMVPVAFRGSVQSPLTVLKEGLSFSGSQVAEAASYRLDQAIALPMIGAVQSGIYSVATTIALIPYALGQAIGSMTFAGIRSSGDNGTGRVLISRSLRLATLAGVCCVVCIAFAVPILVPIVFGPEFSSAVVPTLISLVGSVFIVIGYVAGSGT